MRRAFRLLVAAALAAAAAPALADDCQTETGARIQAALSKTPLEAGLADGIKGLLTKPRFYEDPKLGATCSRPKLDTPLYPGIPVSECTYQHLGLSGWVMVASPSADVAAKWISNACADTGDAKACAMRLTAQSWCASQFSFPVVGNLIAPVSGGDGKTIGVNKAFLHGVEIPRPQWLPEKTPVAAEVQKQRLAPLAANEKAYGGLAGHSALPAGIAPTAYAKYAALPASAGKKQGFGDACPTFARRGDWISASRASYNQAWRNGRNSLFDAAAKALMAGEPVSGAVCK